MAPPPVPSSKFDRRDIVLIDRQRVSVCFRDSSPAFARPLSGDDLYIAAVRKAAGFPSDLRAKLGIISVGAPPIRNNCPSELLRPIFRLQLADSCIVEGNIQIGLRVAHQTVVGNTGTFWRFAISTIAPATPNFRNRTKTSTPALKAFGLLICVSLLPSAACTRTSAPNSSGA